MSLYGLWGLKMLDYSVFTSKISTFYLLGISLLTLSRHSSNSIFLVHLTFH